MKKVVLTGLHTFDIIDSQKPVLEKNDDVLIKIECVGVCGSDLHYYSMGRIGDQIISYPFTPGHECTGLVEEIGPAVTSVAPGDRICLEPAISCGHCDQCLSGREHICRNLEFIGNPQEREGGLQEFLAVPERSCFKLPDSLSWEQGILIEPLTIALHSLSFVKDAGNAAILGAGPIGLSVLAGLRMRQQGRIFVTDLVNERLQMARTHGACKVAHARRDDLVAELFGEFADGADTVFECCGQQDALDQALEILKPGGRLIIVGIPEQDRITLDIHALRRKEISVYNVRRQNRQFKNAMALLKEGKINLDHLLTHSFGFRDTQSAFGLVEGYRDGVIKATITF